MASVKISAYEIAQLFGLAFVNVDFKDEDDNYYPEFVFTYQGVEFRREFNYFTKAIEEVKEEVAQEVLYNIGKCTVMK